MANQATFTQHNWEHAYVISSEFLQTLGTLNVFWSLSHSLSLSLSRCISTCMHIWHILIFKHGAASNIIPHSSQTNTYAVSASHPYYAILIHILMLGSNPVCSSQSPSWPFTSPVQHLLLPHLTLKSPCSMLKTWTNPQNLATFWPNERVLLLPSIMEDGWYETTSGDRIGSAGEYVFFSVQEVVLSWMNWRDILYALLTLNRLL